jgi:hypothetical protein
MPIAARLRLARVLVVVLVEPVGELMLLEGDGYHFADGLVLHRLASRVSFAAWLALELH